LNKLQKYCFYSFIILLSFQSCGIKLIETKALKIITFKQYQKIIESSNKTLLVNFWATWCKPCVAELPYFEESLESTQGEKIKFTYVSLDFEKHVESKLLPFLNESKIKADVVLLSDEKYNNWIDRVDPSWSGAIPATLITLNSKKIFYEGSFHSEKEILDLIKKIKS